MLPLASLKEEKGLVVGVSLELVSALPRGLELVLAIPRELLRSDEMP